MFILQPPLAVTAVKLLFRVFNNMKFYHDTLNNSFQNK